MSKVRYLVFDIESVADAPLVAKLRYPGESLDPLEAVRRFRNELMIKYESDFIPYTFQIPISVAVGKVTADFQLLDVVLIDQPEFRPHEITAKFWAGWEAYGRPTFVSFNGRGFDIPMLELAAFRYGISIPSWFQGGKGYDNPRNRFNTGAHIDLCELLTNHGASRFNGGLNLAANLLGKPGKMDIQGDMVQDMYQQGKLDEINDYCRCDVLDSYFVFLRTRVMIGQLSLDEEQRLVTKTREWLENQSADIPVYAHYLRNWGDWVNPWTFETERDAANQSAPVSEDASPAPPAETPASSEPANTPEKDLPDENLESNPHLPHG